MRLANGVENPDKWADLETQRFLWGWDAEGVARRAWGGKICLFLVVVTVMLTWTTEVCGQNSRAANI